MHCPKHQECSKEPAENRCLQFPTCGVYPLIIIAFRNGGLVSFCRNGDFDETRYEGKNIRTISKLKKAVEVALLPSEGWQCSPCIQT